MINLRFVARAQPLNPIICKKAECVYHYRTTFSPSAINRYFMLAHPEKDILCGLSPGYGYFSRGSSEIQKDFLAPDFYLNCCFFCLCFFLLFNKRILLLILLTQTLVEELGLLKTLYLRGKADQLAVLTFNNSPRTRLVALKYGSARELVISVTLNSVRQTTANVFALL